MPIERRKSALPWLTELSKYLDKKKMTDWTVQSVIVNR